MVKHQAIGLKVATRGTANTTGMFFSLYPFFLPQAAPGWGICPLHLHHLMNSAAYEFSHYSEEREAKLQRIKSTWL